MLCPEAARQLCMHTDVHKVAKGVCYLIGSVLAVSCLAHAREPSMKKRALKSLVFLSLCTRTWPCCGPASTSARLSLPECCAQGQQPERPFSTPPAASLEAAATAAEEARDQSQSAPPPDIYSGRLPAAASPFSYQVQPAVSSLRQQLNTAFLWVP